MMRYLSHRFFLFFSFLISFSLECKEEPKIPPLIHWIRLDSSPLSKTEIFCIKSWQKIHPKWQFKLWTNAPCSLRTIQVHKLHFPLSDVATLRKNILQKEGGICIDLDLIGCKTLEKLALSCEAFETADAHSIIGCAPNHYDTARTTLPPSFLLPDQVFITQTFSSPWIGACFRHFKDLPALTETLWKIQSAKTIAKIQTQAVSRKISKIKILFFIIFLLCLLNTLFFIRWFSSFFTLKRMMICLGGALLLILMNIPFKWPSPSPEWDLQDFFSLSDLTRYPQKLPESDLKQLAIYKTLFQHRFLQNQSVEKEPIPPIIHFIWGGGPFPKNSIANIASWMRFHPDWIFKFWTDDPNRSLPLEGMEKHLFDEIFLSTPIRHYFEQSQNWGEKSDLLRYVILLHEGGIYVDHDIECFHSFAPLNRQLNFYASMEPFHQSPIYSSHLTVTNCLIGTIPNHPILSEALTLSLAKWNRGSEIFPCNDQLSTLFRTLYRTFSPFDEAIASKITDSPQSVILPPTFIFPKWYPSSLSEKLEKANYPSANHQWANTWFEEFYDIATPHFPEIFSRKVSSLLKLCFQITFLLFLLLTTITLVKIKQVKKCSKKSSFSFSV